MTTPYVDNKKFQEAIKLHKLKCLEAEKSGEERPRIPDYIGRCILLITTNLARRPNFNGYTYKDEMISDGYEHCIRYFYNFNSDKYDNPFAYFTKIAYYAFVRRITSEKKQSKIKSGLIINSGIFGLLISQQEGDLNNYDEGLKEFLKDYIDNDLLEREEEKTEAKKEKRKEAAVPAKPKGLEEFFDTNGNKV